MPIKGFSTCNKMEQKSKRKEVRTGTGYKALALDLREEKDENEAHHRSSATRAAYMW